MFFLLLAIGLYCMNACTHVGGVALKVFASSNPDYFVFLDVLYFAHRTNLVSKPTCGAGINIDNTCLHA